MLSGALPVLLTLTGTAALVFLLARRPQWWWRKAVPAAVGGTVAVMVLAIIVLAVWRPFPDALPARVVFWAAFGVLGLALGLANAPSASWRRRAASVVAVLSMVAVTALQINAEYAYRPTLRAALGLHNADEVNFTAIAPPEPDPAPAPEPPKPLWQTWHPPPDQPVVGAVTQVNIPGPVSGFAGRAASLYLPPAYLSSARPALPVLVLISGQPGGPIDWVLAGKLATTMDSFAEQHGGLAPIVVVPDGTGAPLANPLCMDSALGNVETYLAVDVPEWLKQNLTVDPDTRHWAIGGFSYGGTCALQLALRRPRLFPTFLDISGQEEPTLGGRARTVRLAFGGDDSKFRAVNPLDILASENFPDSAGILATGDGDLESSRQADQVAEAARKAGMAIQVSRAPGKHSWAIATEALSSGLPWLAARAELLPPS